MAMNRVINSIWAEISAWGSLVKTATNPYTPSPGSADSTSNNQGLAALAAGSPFITVNSSGISPDVPVATNFTARVMAAIDREDQFTFCFPRHPRPSTGSSPT